MSEFFAVYKGHCAKFQTFSSFHIALLVALGVVIVSIIIFQKNLRHRTAFYRYFIAIVSLVLECSYLVWLVSVGKWDIKTSLPFELCELTFILCIIMLLVKSYIVFEVAYFWGFIGSTLALIFPNLHASYYHFPFWAFMLTHSLNLISLVFMTSIEKYKPTRKSIWVAFMITNIYMLLMTTINYFLGSNYYYYYVFSKPAPNIPNFFMYTNSGLVKILILEGITISALLIGYFPFIVANVFKGKFLFTLQKRHRSTKNLISPGNEIVN